MMYLISPRDEYEWHTSEFLPFHPQHDSMITEIHADGDELNCIIRLVPDITPDEWTAHTYNWRGDKARQIVKAMRKNEQTA